MTKTIWTNFLRHCVVFLLLCHWRNDLSML